MSTPHFHWFLPMFPDGRAIIPTGADARPPSLDYLADVARAAEHNEFESVLTPTGSGCEDPWLTTAALIQTTQRLKFLVAFRPGLTHPTLVAQMIATYQRLSSNRLIVNVVTGGNQAEQESYGDFADKDTRYARTDEFLEVLRGCWDGRPYSFEGAHYRVRNGGLVTPLRDRPPIFFGGASPAAERVAARHADVQLLFGETPPMAAERIERLRPLAAEHGRTPEFGIRLHVINRDTSAEAWAEADRLLDITPDAFIAQMQAKMRDEPDAGQARILSLHNGTKADRAALQVYPNVWAGTGLVSGGGGTALVGSHEEVAERIREYQSIGIEHFILSGYPKLESAYWFGEGVVPLFRGAESLEGSARTPVAV
jgi:alkanesulfonate monooxygenase